MTSRNHPRRWGVGAVVLATALPLLAGCFETGVEHWRDGPTARTLDDARMAIASRRSKSARMFYQQQFKADPAQAEPVYVLSALDMEAGFSRSWDKVSQPKPGHVMAWLPELQFHTRPPFNLVKRLQQTYYSQPLRMDFAPIEMGTVDGMRRLFDAASAVAVYMGIELTREWLQLTQMIQLQGVETLDRKLVEARKEIWGRLECAADVNAVACAQATMNRALKLFHDTQDRDFGTAFTLSTNAGRVVALNAQQMVKTMNAFLSAMTRREPLGRNAEYLVRSPKPENLQLAGCLAGACRTPWGVRVDIPGFLRKLAVGRDLRVLVPTQVTVVERGSRNPADLAKFFRGLVFKDPTLGGLFPDGDLVRTALREPNSQIARFVWAYCGLFTDWLFEADPR